jgi:hypothetical protein
MRRLHPLRPFHSDGPGFVVLVDNVVVVRR